MSPVTLQDAKDYLGIDITDDMTERNLERLLDTADAYLSGSLGTDYPRDDARAKELALLVIQDLFDNRTMEARVSNSIRRMVDDFSWQLRLELSDG